MEYMRTPLNNSTHTMEQMCTTGIKAINPVPITITTTISIEIMLINLLRITERINVRLIKFLNYNPIS